MLPLLRTVKCCRCRWDVQRSPNAGSASAPGSIKAALGRYPGSQPRWGGDAALSLWLLLIPEGVHIYSRARWSRRMCLDGVIGHCWRLLLCVLRQSFCGRIQYPDGSEVEYLPSSWQAWDRYFPKEEKVLLQMSLRTSMPKSIHASVWRRVILPEQAQATS